MLKLIQNRKVLFVVPSASINGAIIVLMHYFKWLKKNEPSIEIEVLVQWGKDHNPDAFFRERLSSFGTVVFLEELDTLARQGLKARYSSEALDGIFYNSIISVETQIFLHDLAVPKFFYVHEMERLMTLFRVQEHAYLYTGDQVHFIACSESVKSALKNVLHIDDHSISLIHEFIDVQEVWDELKESTHDEFGGAEEKETGIVASQDFTIGFSGTFELRKGADLLPSLLIEINKRIANKKIMWVGASSFIGEPGTFCMVKQDLDLAGLSQVHLIPKGMKVFKYYKSMDVFITLSREDAFPVVNLEMGALGVPIICFRGSGGSEEYAMLGGGVALPFMDLGAIADQVKFFYDNRTILRDYQNSTPQLVKEAFTVEVQAPKVHDVIMNRLR